MAVGRREEQQPGMWVATTSLPLREFLTVIRQRLPLGVPEAVFARILAVVSTKGLLQGTTVAVDATTLEATRSMKSIVRRDTGASWQQYICRLATEEGVTAPTDADARRLDRRRKKKRVSNADWQAPSDPASRRGRARADRLAFSVVSADAVAAHARDDAAGNVAVFAARNPPFFNGLFECAPR